MENLFRGCLEGISGGRERKRERQRDREREKEETDKEGRGRETESCLFKRTVGRERERKGAEVSLPQWAEGERGSGQSLSLKGKRY